MICLIIAVAAGWAWVDSYGVSHFVGTRSVVASGTLRGEYCRGAYSRDGTLALGATRIVWDNSIPRPAFAAAEQGGLCVTLIPDGHDPLLGDDQNSGADDSDRRDLNLTRFAWAAHSRPSGTPLGAQSRTLLTVPHWCVVALFATPPVAWVIGLWRDRKRYPRGHCPS